MFSTFAAARDAFYGAALLVGLAVGFALRILKGRKYRNMLVTGALYLFSLALFVTAVVFIFSRGAVLYDRDLVRVALSIAGFTVICVLFPVTAAYPAVMIAGALVVWVGIVFWRYPREPDPQKNVQIAVRCGDLIPLIGGETRYFDREPDDSPLFREEFAILSPAKNRLVFSFVSNRKT
jgi:vacuolar-type H+-ATPase subunit I/STV1